MSIGAMQNVLTRFAAQLPALKSLVDRIQATGIEKGYLTAVDGRWGRIRSRKGKILEHTMLNVLLQMTGSLTMKYSLCFAERTMLQELVGLDSTGWPTWMANQHDEMQMEVPRGEVLFHSYLIGKDEWKAEEKREHRDEQGRLWSAPIKYETTCDGEYIVVHRYYHRAGEIIAESITRAGTFLKLRCPTAGEYKIGRNWQETH